MQLGVLTPVRAADLFDAGPLRRDADPFASNAVNHASRPVQAAFREIVRQLLQQTPVVLVTGPASAGKTLLVDLTARLCLDMGLAVSRLDRGDLLHVALGHGLDVLLVDEANYVDDGVLESFAPGKREQAAGTTIFFGLPSCLPRFAAAIDPFHIAFDLLSQSDAEHYLKERAASAGFTDLFSAEAMALILNASSGSPRLLRRMASLAYVNAASDGAFQIGPKHAAAALDMQLPPDIATYAVNQNPADEQPVLPDVKLGERPVPEKKPLRTAEELPRIEPDFHERAPIPAMAESDVPPRNDMWARPTDGIAVARLEGESHHPERRGRTRYGALVVAAVVLFAAAALAVGVVRPWHRAPVSANLPSAAQVQPAAAAALPVEPAISPPAPSQAASTPPPGPAPAAIAPQPPPQTQTVDTKPAETARAPDEPPASISPPLSAEERAAVAKGVRELERAQSRVYRNRR
jgi:hypothetical protein